MICFGLSVSKGMACVDIIWEKGGRAHGDQVPVNFPQQALVRLFVEVDHFALVALERFHRLVGVVRVLEHLLRHAPIFDGVRKRRGKIFLDVRVKIGLIDGRFLRVRHSG